MIPDRSGNEEHMTDRRGHPRDTLQFMNDCLSLGLARWVDRPGE
jgi:hypothetical protein